MKKLLTLLCSILCIYSAQANLIITGVVDGPLPGGLPKAIELYTIADIADLSQYGLGSANNGGGTDGEEFTFPAISQAAGTFIYVTTDSTAFADYFGFSADYVEGAASNINGDDAIELFQNGTVIDIFGDINVDGTGQTWEHTDSWAYRMNGTGPDGTTFVETNWTFPGVDVLDGTNTNAEAANPFPIGTYQYTAPSNPVLSFVGAAMEVNEDAGSVMVEVSIIAPNDNPTTVEVNLGMGSTANAADFTYTNTTLTFPANDNANQSVTITITDDMDMESAETIVLELVNPSNNATFGAGTTYTITILDNDTPIRNLVITEINYNSPSEDSLEYIEIYNNDTVAVDLIGYSIANAIVHTFPTSTVLAPGAYLVVSNNAAAMTNAYGLTAVLQWNSGSLNNTGETIELYDTSGNLVDEVTYADGGNFPSSPDGGGPSLELCDVDADNNDPVNWLAADNDAGFVIGDVSIFGTPGSENTVECPDFIPVKIGFDDPYPFGTELVPEDAGILTIDIILTQGQDFPSTIMVDLASSTATSGVDFNFTPFTHTFDDSLAMDTFSFSIEILDDTEEETVENIIIHMTSMDTMVDLQDTLLIINIADNDGMADSLVITEIMYNLPGDDDYEFIEIYNNSSSTIDLSGASFQEGIFHFFEAGTMINAGSYLVVTNDSIAFVDAFGVPAIQWDNGGLSNSGEAIALYDNSGMLADFVQYDDNSPFPTSPDGNGPSLELCDVNEDNNNGINWFASQTSVMVDSVEIFATPGAANTVECLGENPLISLASASSSFNEDAGTGFVTVEITNGNDTATVVTFTVEASSTATDGMDYSLGSTTLTFPAGTVTGQQTLQITLIDDEDVEGNETIVFTITADNNATLGDITTHTMTIVDNDEVSNRDIFAGQVSIFPNPAREFLTLETRMALDDIRLLNVLGQTVLQRKDVVGQAQIQVSSLPKGIYFLQMTAGGESHTEQVVVE